MRILATITTGANQPIGSKILATLERTERLVTEPVVGEKFSLKQKLSSWGRHEIPNTAKKVPLSVNSRESIANRWGES